MAEELGLEFEHVPLEFDDPALKREDFRKLNPAAAIPTIVDDGFALSESLAINLYLASKYGSRGAGDLYPDSAQFQAQAWRWSLWAQGHLEPWVQKDLTLADLISAIGPLGDGMVQHSLSVLATTLAQQTWLAADHFTVADLNVAAVLSPSRAKSLNFRNCGNVDAWLTRCYARPAAVAVRRKFPR